MKKCRAWLFCILWMGFIFFMSATPGDLSGEESGRVVKIIVDTVLAVCGEATAAQIDTSVLEVLVRKAAHMTEYAILFLLSRRALRLSGARRPSLCAMVLSAAYAATDEFHQSFVGGRYASPVDVMIDTSGAALACGASALIRRLRARF